MMREDYRNIVALDGSYSNMIGYASEMIVAGLASHAGCVVSLPTWRDCKYDMIVDNGNRLFKCQIKSTTTSSIKTTSGGRGGQQLDPNREDRSEILSQEQIDVWIGCQVEQLKVFLVPCEVIEILQNTSLSVNKLSAYEDAWKLFNANPDMYYDPVYLTRGIRDMSSQALGQLRVNIGLMPRFPSAPHRYRLGNSGPYAEFSRMDRMVLEIWEYWASNL